MYKGIKVHIPTSVFILSSKTNLNWPFWASISFIFDLFKQTILQQINVKKCPFGIWCWDLTPRPLDMSFLP